MRYALTLFLVLGCAPAAVPEVPRLHVAVSDPCDPDEGLELDASGEVVHGITQAALCCRFEQAYEARRAELGCAAPFPAEACEDRGLEDCLVELVDEWADFSWALECEDLEAYAAEPETYEGFVCGSDCELTGPSGESECCPGTPYELRSWQRCPYWCDGLPQCGADPECEDLLRERGPRRF